MKISVITLNPGIDRIIYLSTTTKIGTLNRAARTVTCQGSKGANAAIVLKTLGADPDYFTFTGGPLGKFSESFTDKFGVRGHFTDTACGIRVNTKVIDTDGVYTEFNEPGGPISEEELNALLSAHQSDNYKITIINGSIPQGVEKNVYNRIINHIKKIGSQALTVLDSDGGAMKLGLDARPQLIKPNKRELAGILGVEERELEGNEKILSGCRAVREEYGADVICTLEADGAIYCGEDGCFRVAAAAVPLCGFTGAGDTFLAAYVYKKYCQGWQTAKSLAYAAAAAGAKIALPGTTLPKREQIDAVFNRGIAVTRI